MPALLIPAICPQCGRRVKARRNRFSDGCYTRHKLANLSSAETVADLKEPVNRSYAYTFELDGPMSGQYVEPQPDDA